MGWCPLSVEGKGQPVRGGAVREHCREGCVPSVQGSVDRDVQSLKLGDRGLNGGQSRLSLGLRLAVLLFEFGKASGEQICYGSHVGYLRGTLKSYRLGVPTAGR
jgi:hypothetical protein